MPKYKKGYMLVTRWNNPPYETIEYFDQYQDAYNTLYMDNFLKGDYKDAFIADYVCVYEDYGMNVDKW